jgi:hypothetical protein
MIFALWWQGEGCVYGVLGLFFSEKRFADEAKAASFWRRLCAGGSFE